MKATVIWVQLTRSGGVAGLIAGGPGANLGPPAYPGPPGSTAG